MFNIVLAEPEIPQNTGNIVRTAAATGCHVHLIKPLGFDISDRALKRAGLDYWHLADFTVYESFQDFFDKNAEGRFCYSNGAPQADWSVKGNLPEREGACYFFSTKAHWRYDEAKFKEGDFLFFGKETKGLPEELLRDNYQMSVRIPMIAQARSLNLSNSVAIAVYEALRQTGFKHLSGDGELTRY
jgi:tRNA (cytidine/uridine-2'-O-)-methyltransferase